MYLSIIHPAVLPRRINSAFTEHRTQLQCAGSILIFKYDLPVYNVYFLKKLSSPQRFGAFVKPRRDTLHRCLCTDFKIVVIVQVHFNNPIPVIIHVFTVLLKIFRKIMKTNIVHCIHEIFVHGRKFLVFFNLVVGQIHVFERVPSGIDSVDGCSTSSQTTQSTKNTTFTTFTAFTCTHRLAGKQRRFRGDQCGLSTLPRFQTFLKP